MGAKPPTWKRGRGQLGVNAGVDQVEVRLG